MKIGFFAAKNAGKIFRSKVHIPMVVQESQKNYNSNNLLII